MCMLFLEFFIKNNNWQLICHNDGNTNKQYLLKSLQMKTLSKLITLTFTASVLLFTSDLKAQTTPANAFRLSIGADAGLPTGNLRIESNFVLGGTIRLHYGISDNFAVTLTSGADHFFSKTLPGTTFKYNSFGIIPIKAGIKEFFVPNIYFAAEAGVGFEQVDSGHANAKLILSPALGYADKHWDFGIRYENYSGQSDNYGFVALRLAYGFALFTK